MTATPRVFGDAVRRKAEDASAVLADMGDETYYGPELHRLGFGEAVPGRPAHRLQSPGPGRRRAVRRRQLPNAMSSSGEIALDDAAKFRLLERPGEELRLNLRPTTTPSR